MRKRCKYIANKKGNNYVVDEENFIAKIELNRRNSENLWTIIDLEDLERVINFPYTWFAKYNHTNDEYYNESLCITTIESIYEKDGEIYIVDSDGDRLKSKWLGISFFLSKEDVKHWYNTIKNRFEREI